MSRQNKMIIGNEIQILKSEIMSEEHLSPPIIDFTLSQDAAEQLLMTQPKPSSVVNLASQKSVFGI